VGVSLLGSRNRNLLAGKEINRTSGRRAAIGVQVQRRFETASIEHRLIIGLDHESERFHARDPFGSTNQDRSRNHQAVTAEWRADAGPIAADLAVRRDVFNRFKDATTLRASLLADVGRGFSLAASYGEGIAQPTFFDLYGFSPAFFVGNPELRPESSRGFEGSVRYAKDAFSASLTAYRQRLHNEIIDVFDFGTGLSSTVNRAQTSKRSGVEAELRWALAETLRVTAAYAYLRATQPGDVGEQVREARRPKHSGSVAADGQTGRLTFGVSLAYTGARRDTDFETFPFRPVRLDPYWLAGARLSFEVGRGVELFARAANAFDAGYQDALGYRTEGRSVHGGIRIASRR
jgi:vitamin B12 transporter